MKSVQYWSSLSSMKTCSYPTLEAYRGSGGAAPLILHLGPDKVNNCDTQRQAREFISGFQSGHQGKIYDS